MEFRGASTTTRYVSLSKQTSLCLYTEAGNKIPPEAVCMGLPRNGGLIIPLWLIKRRVSTSPKTKDADSRHFSSQRATGIQLN